MKPQRNKLLSTLIVRSKTNEGELAKQYFYYSVLDGMEAIVVRKYVLSSHSTLIGHKCVKTFKDKKLFMSRFSIRPNTLMCVARWASNVEPNTIFKAKL